MRLTLCASVFLQVQKRSVERGREKIRVRSWAYLVKSNVRSLPLNCRMTKATRKYGAVFSGRRDWKFPSLWPINSGASLTWDSLVTVHFMYLLFSFLICKDVSPKRL